MRKTERGREGETHPVKKGLSVINFFVPPLLFLLDLPLPLLDSYSLIIPLRMAELQSGCECATPCSTFMGTKLLLLLVMMMIKL